MRDDVILGVTQEVALPPNIFIVGVPPGKPALSLPRLMPRAEIVCPVRIGMCGVPLGCFAQSQAQDSSIAIPPPLEIQCVNEILPSFLGQLGTPQ